MAQSKVADRLLVHARLCRQLAARSLNEELAERLLHMAESCIEAAADSSAIENMKETPSH